MGGEWIMSEQIPDDRSWSDLRNLHELRRKRLVAQVNQTRRFALYLRTRGKPSRIMRQKTCCASESNTSVCVVLANRSGFDAPIGVVLAWQERGSCLNIFRMTNRGRISEKFTTYEAKDLLRKFWTKNRGRISENLTNYEAKDLLRKSVDHVLKYFGRQIVVVSQKTSRITRQKTCCASESNTSVRVVFANQSGFDAPIGVVLAWEERGSCLNIFRMTNRDRILETFMNYEAKDLLRKSQNPSRITRQKTCCASESNTSVRVVFANRSGFYAPMGVVWAWEERGSCLNIFRMTNCGQILEIFTNYEANRLVAQVSQTHQCALYLRTVVVLMLQSESSWHGRSVNHVLIFQTTNRGRISETFMNYEAKDLLRKRKIAVGSQEPSRISRQNTCCASESNTSVRAVLANQSGFDAPIGVVLAWEEPGSCLNIFRTTNHGRNP
ncbi:uncharacterized protein G2W53_014407 [Senna tora]|uniref:Uncharacterized protein n=1 Tax=Senna tora TaxID=362788 RepID=A0A834WTF7_9FABA|nr:uncharacterized protein G2W53_014407 [Senna tora]